MRTKSVPSKLYKKLDDVASAISWVDVQKDHDMGMITKDICAKYDITVANYRTAFTRGYITRNQTAISNSVKKRASEQMIKFWKDSPEKGRERILRSQNSKPCQNVKDFLKSCGIVFIEEFNPQIPERYFSIDIALPDKMIAIEINGSHHYIDKSCTQFTDYHLERKRLIEEHGWKVVDIHTNLCFHFNNDFWKILVSNLKDRTNIRDFDYDQYIPPSYHTFCKCGKQIFPNYKYRTEKYEFACKKCAGVKRRKIIDIDKLIALYKSCGAEKCCADMGISKTLLYRCLKENNVTFKKNSDISISTDELRILMHTHGLTFTAKQFKISTDILKRILDERQIEWSRMVKRIK